MIIRHKSVFNFAFLKTVITSQESRIVRKMMAANLNTQYPVNTRVVADNIVLKSRLPLLLTKAKDKSYMEMKTTVPRPMLVLLEYMNAREEHVHKIAEIYLDRGFEVLQIHLTPGQLLFPMKGSQVVAKTLADFLLSDSFSPLIIHGFSVGGYVWGETLVHFKQNLDRYQKVIDKIMGQIFDSPADFEAIPTAFPSSVFPNNVLLRKAFQKYLSLHLKWRYKTATEHYIRSREAFTSGLVPAPTLFITSNSDVLSSSNSVLKARQEILEKNLEAYIKIFDGSQHVMHFKKYRHEYIMEIDNFLRKIGFYGSIQMRAKI